MAERPFFVDANVVVYAARADEIYGAACAVILDAVVNGVSAVSSVAVLEEVLHYELSVRDHDARGVAGAAYAMLTPLLPVTDATLRDALEVDNPELGANDRVHVATCRENGIRTIVTADRGFDGIRGLRRVDPLDAEAVGRLIGA